MIVYKIAAVILKPIFYLLFVMRVRGKENIPDGAAIVSCNHTSLLDPVILGIAFGARHPLRFMAKKELFNNKLFGAVLRCIGVFPVDRESVDLATIRTSLQVLKNGDKLMMFPEGKRVFEEDESRENVKMGVGMIASRANVPIVPVYISGNKRLFHRTRIVIGKPIEPVRSEATHNENYMSTALKVFDQILSLGKAE